MNKNKQFFLLLNGAMGSGKSTIAQMLSKKLDRTAIIEIEDIRKLVTGPEDNALAWNVIYRMCDEYFKNGLNVLLNQTVASQDLVNKFLKLARKHKCNIGFYHLQTPKSVLLERIAKRKKTGKVPKSLIASNIQKHEDISYLNATVIDSSTMSPESVTKLILKNL